MAGRSALLLAVALATVGRARAGTAFMDAIAAGDLTTAKLALAADPSVLNQRGDDPEGLTPLMQGVMTGNENVTTWLLGQPGLKLDEQSTKTKLTALMYSAMVGQPTLGALLVGRKANLNLQTASGWTALMFCCQDRQPELGQLLLRHGADLAPRSSLGDPALILCAKAAEDTLTEAILNAGAFVNEANHAGQTALWAAADKGHLSTAKILVRYGADARQEDADGKSPRAAALAGGHAEVAEFLETLTPSPSVMFWFMVKCVGVGLFLGLGAAGTGHVLAGLFCPPPDSDDSESEEGRARTMSFGRRDMELGKAGQSCCVPPEESEASADSDEDLPDSDAEISRGAWNQAASCVIRRNGNLPIVFNKAYRLLEVFAVVVFPLGYCMLFIRPEYFLPLYALLYVAPVLGFVGLRDLRERTSVLLSGAVRRGGVEGPRDPRIIRLLATTFLLFFTGVFASNSEHSECFDDLFFVLNGFHAAGGREDHLFSQLMVGGGSWSALNVAGTMRACPAWGVGAADGDRFARNQRLLPYFGALWWCAALWLLVTALEVTALFECAGLARRLWPTFDGCEMKLRKLGLAFDALLEDNSKAAWLRDYAQTHYGLPLVSQDGCSVCCTLMWALLDALVVELVVIIFLLQAAYHRAAAALIFIVVTAFTLEVVNGNVCSLARDVKQTLRTGVLCPGLRELLDREKGFEAPLSLMLTAYVFPFALRSPVELAVAVLSVILSSCGLSTYVHNYTDSWFK